jgi:ribose 5-phosphate isomerase B
MSLSDTNKVFHLATDHAGFEHKEAIVKWLREEGFKVVDHGAKSYELGSGGR